MTKHKLNHFQGPDDEFYFRLGQVVSLHDKFYQHQVRYSDSFESHLIGHFLLDEYSFEVKMPDDSMPSLRIACEILHKRSEDERDKFVSRLKLSARNRR